MNYLRAGLVLVAVAATVGCGDDATGTGGGSSSGDSTGAPTTTVSMATTDDSATTTTADPSTTGVSSSGTSSSSDTSSSSGGSDSGSSSGSSDSSSGSSGMVLPDCEYPISWPADAGAQATAQSELDILSPEAMMSWNEDRGTFSSIFGMDVVIPCPDNEPLLDAVFDYFGDHQDLFPMDGAEWFTGTGTQCQHVTSATGNTYNTSRRDFGQWLVARDSVAVRLLRGEDGAVHMTSVVATFLPTVPEEIETEIAACVQNGPDPQALEDAVREENYDYLIYGGGAVCQPSGNGSYDPQPEDAVNFSDGALVGWFEAGNGSATITVAQRLELVVDDSNESAELLASSAACPKQDMPGTVVGFVAFVDVVTAEIVSTMAGLGCIVC